MIGSLFNDLKPEERDEPETPGKSETPEPTEEPPLETEREDDLVASLSVAEKIVRRRRSAFRQSEADILQVIALQLVKWRDRYREKSAAMMTGDWRFFTARTAFNEVNRHFSRDRSNDLPIEAAAEVAAPETPEGETRAEVVSLIRRFWQEIRKLSLRQRRALLLHNDEFVMYFLEIGITEKELAAVLEMSVADWLVISERMPLTDAEIAEMLWQRTSGHDQNLEVRARSIKKARHEARVKLKKITKR